MPIESEFPLAILAIQTLVVIIKLPFFVVVKNWKLLNYFFSQIIHNHFISLALPHLAQFVIVVFSRLATRIRLAAKPVSEPVTSGPIRS